MFKFVPKILIVLCMIDLIKSFIKRKIEKNPFFSWIIFKNIHQLEFLFPHEQDYFGMKNIFSENFKGDFLDIGGNYWSINRKL